IDPIFIASNPQAGRCEIEDAIGLQSPRQIESVILGSASAAGNIGADNRRSSDRDTERDVNTVIGCAAMAACDVAKIKDSSDKIQKGCEIYAIAIGAAAAIEEGHFVCIRCTRDGYAMMSAARAVAANARHSNGRPAEKRSYTNP